MSKIQKDTRLDRLEEDLIGLEFRVVFENQENIEKTCYPKGFSKFIFVVSIVWYHVWDCGEMIWLTRSCDFVIDNYILGKFYCDQKGVIIIMTAAPVMLS